MFIELTCRETGKRLVNSNYIQQIFRSSNGTVVELLSDSITVKEAYTELKHGLVEQVAQSAGKQETQETHATDGIDYSILYSDFVEKYVWRKGIKARLKNCGGAFAYDRIIAPSQFTVKTVLDNYDEFKKERNLGKVCLQAFWEGLNRYKKEIIAQQ